MAKESPKSPPSPPIRLFLADAYTSEPVLRKALPRSTARNQDAPEKVDDTGFLWKRGGDVNDLSGQRWGVIAPEGPDGDRLLKLIEPLIEHRSKQQGAPVKRYRCPPRFNMTMTEAADWHRVKFDQGQTFSRELPRYQLLLGDLDQVPLSLQQVQLAADGLVGRLAFRTDADYSSYVQKIIKYEQQAPKAPKGRSLFYTVRGSDATDLAYEQLVEPSVRAAEQDRQDGMFPASEVLDLSPGFRQSPEELLRAVSGDQPGVLFSASHGLGPPSAGWTTAEQRILQGAMGFSRKVWLGARELAGQRFLPGGLWFMFACYGAGTPATSAYRRWLEQLARSGQFGGDAAAVLNGLPKVGERPFIAALPQAVLASEQGPLGFIGHIDLAWSYSFNENNPADEGRSRPGQFLDVIQSLLSGDRFGNAFGIFSGSLNQKQTELVSLYDREAAVNAKELDESSRPDPAYRGHLWMVRQDLAGYMLLGDPAARLAFAPASVEPPHDSRGGLVASMFPFATSPTETEPARTSTLDVEAYEPAIMRVLLGLRDAEELATEYQLDADTLRTLAKAYREGGRAAAARALDPNRR